MTQDSSYTTDFREDIMKRKLFISAELLLVSCLFVLLQNLLMPKYMEKMKEGALAGEYYLEEKAHDVLFIGDCEVYEVFSPKVLWEEYGINSYIRGTPAQTVSHSYYLLEEMLEEEDPKAVVFNIMGMQYDEPQRESYNRMTLDGMKWSGHKLAAIRSSLLPEESLVEYIFPLLRFHSRWSELEKEDFKYIFGRDTVSHNGYLMNTDIRPAGGVPKGKPLADYSFSEKNYEYLDKMTALCKEKGVEFILMKAPVLYPYWYPEWERQIEEYATKNGLKYINYLDIVETVGLDFSTDTYDGGLHLNVYGAEKMSIYFGRFLQKELGFADRRQEAELSKVWEKKIKRYDEEKNR